MLNAKGEVEISDELVIKPCYTFEQFKNTRYYSKQDGIRIIYLDEQQVIEGRNI